MKRFIVYNIKISAKSSCLLALRNKLNRGKKSPHSSVNRKVFNTFLRLNNKVSTNY